MMENTTDKDRATLAPAGYDDLESVVSLYREAAGSEFSTWNEYYPTEEEASADLAAGCLYTLKKGGEIVGAISVVPERELDDLPCWRVRGDGVREIARVVIADKYRGRGYSKIMVSELLAKLRSERVCAVHLTVAIKNLPAQALYRSQGFSFCPEKFSMWGNEYYACEKIFED